MLRSEWVPALRCAPAGNAALRGQCLSRQQAVGSRARVPLGRDPFRILSTATPDKARRAADPGPTRLATCRDAYRKPILYQCVASRVGPGSPLRCGRECVERWRIHPQIREYPSISQPQPRTRPTGPPIRGLLAAQLAATRTENPYPINALRAEWVPALRCAPAGNASRDGVSIPKSGSTLRSHNRNPGQCPQGRRSGAHSPRNLPRRAQKTRSLSTRCEQSGSRLSAALRPGMRREMAYPSPDPGTPFDPTTTTPDKAREGRRSGAHSPRNLPRRAQKVRSLSMRCEQSGSRLSAALRPGMRPFGSNARAGSG